MPATSPNPNRIRLIAFYLPQFHPTPENDAWWGKGFTEWTNVAAAKPLFPGHYQPQLPADLGFYDLRLPEVRQAQAELAAEYGVYGFCYYHYWFNGRRLLERPVSDMLASGRPDFPFCLCWANENWTRAWDGLDQHVLIEQAHSIEDDIQHIRWLSTVFTHRNYIRIDGKPLFLVYRASKIPDLAGTTSTWREVARELGIGEIYLGMVESLPDDRLDPARHGFDAAVEFQPDWVNLGAPVRQVAEGTNVYDYAAIVERMLEKNKPPYPRFPCVTPSWDNTARRTKNACILEGSTPELYQHWLEQVIERFDPPSSDENLIFVNAWNEWGEAAYLEPSRKWGHAYLEATRNALVNKGVAPELSFTPTDREKSDHAAVGRSEEREETSELGPGQSHSQPDFGEFEPDIEGVAVRRRVIMSLSGEDVASEIPLKTLIKALAFKLASKPGFRWLRHLRRLGKLFLD